jgi:hypothetical protein
LKSKFFQESQKKGKIFQKSQSLPKKAKIGQKSQKINKKNHGLRDLHRLRGLHDLRGIDGLCDLHGLVGLLGLSHSVKIVQYYITDVLFTMKYKCSVLGNAPGLL